MTFDDTIFNSMQMSIDANSGEVIKVKPLHFTFLMPEREREHTLRIRWVSEGFSASTTYCNAWKIALVCKLRCIICHTLKLCARACDLCP